MSIERTDNPNWKVHPGEILKEEFLVPVKMSAYELAKRLDVPTPRINDGERTQGGVHALVGCAVLVCLCLTMLPGGARPSGAASTAINSSTTRLWPIVGVL
jgi:hypothetical protein